MRLYCVRHGQSLGNSQNIFEQEDGTALSPVGREQARVVSHRFKKLPIDVILASDLTRAKQTAEIINKQVKTSLECLPLLREYRDNSYMRGKTWDDPEVKAYLAKKQEIFHDPDARINDEETFTEIVDRCSSFLDYVGSRKEKTILVVSHGYFLNIVTAIVVMGRHRLTPELADHFYNYTWFNNTGITIFDEWEPGRWYLLSWNDHAHIT